VLYVERLIAPGVVNTMPEKTLHLFAEHGNVGTALDANLAEVELVLAQARDAGLDVPALTSELEREGVQAFCASYDELLDCIGSKVDPLAGVERAAGGDS
jgi:transaldolase